MLTAIFALLLAMAFEAPWWVYVIGAILLTADVWFYCREIENVAKKKDEPDDNEGNWA